jgi:hypothetical protein
MGVGGQRHAPAAVPPGKRAGAQCTGPFLVSGPVMMDGNSGWAAGMCEGECSIR